MSTKRNTFHFWLAAVASATAAGSLWSVPALFAAQSAAAADAGCIPAVAKQMRGGRGL
jgi:hypothetical protein